MLQAIAGPDPRDPSCLREAAPDYLADLDRGIQGLRLAWSPDLGYAAVEPEVLEATSKATLALTGLGATVEVIQVKLEEPFVPFWNLFTANAFGAYQEVWEQYGDRLGPLTVKTLEYGLLVSGAEYSHALASVERLNAQVTNLFEQYDLLLTPTVAVPAFPLDARPEKINEQRVEPLWGFLPFTFPFNMTGNPAASIPCGFSRDGLPIGLQIVGRLGDEASVLRTAAAFEQAHPWAHHKPPGLSV